MQTNLHHAASSPLFADTVALHNLKAKPLQDADSDAANVVFVVTTTRTLNTALSDCYSDLANGVRALIDLDAQVKMAADAKSAKVSRKPTTTSKRSIARVCLRKFFSIL
jgi:hypothetical protein